MQLKQMKKEYASKIQELETLCQDRSNEFAALEAERKELEEQLKMLEQKNKALEDQFSTMLDKFERYIDEHEQNDIMTVNKTETAIQEFNTTIRDTDSLIKKLQVDIKDKEQELMHLTNEVLQLREDKRTSGKAYEMELGRYRNAETENLRAQRELNQINKIGHRDGEIKANFDEINNRQEWSLKKLVPRDTITSCGDATSNLRSPSQYYQTSKKEDLYHDEYFHTVRSREHEPARSYDNKRIPYHQIKVTECNLTFPSNFTVQKTCDYVNLRTRRHKSNPLDPSARAAQ